LNKKLILIRSPQAPLIKGGIKGGIKKDFMGGEAPKPKYGQLKPKA